MSRVIKLTVEIIDDKFKYDYQVGESKRSSEHPLCPDALVVFTNMLNMASRAYINEHEEWVESIKAKAYIEKHPELLKAGDK